MGLLPILGLCTLNCAQLGDSWRLFAQVCNEMKAKQSESNQSSSSNSLRIRNIDATVNRIARRKCLDLGKGDGMTHFTIVILYLIKWL